MKKIAVENIQDGMVLVKDVLGSSGNTLLNAGITLSSSMGRRLKNWGIPFVFIQGEEEETEATTQSLISPEEVNSLLSAKFIDVIHNPIMHDIFTAVYRHKVNQKKTGGEHERNK